MRPWGAGKSIPGYLPKVHTWVVMPKGPMAAHRVSLGSLYCRPAPTTYRPSFASWHAALQTVCHGRLSGNTFAATSPQRESEMRTCTPVAVPVEAR